MWRDSEYIFDYILDKKLVLYTVEFSIYVEVCDKRNERIKTQNN